MMNTIVVVFMFIAMVVFCTVTFILANIDRIIKEDTIMENIIKVTPNTDGKIFITLYGTRYQIIVEEQPKPANKIPKKEEK